MSRETFRKHEHLQKPSDFDRVYQARCSASDELMVVYAAGNELDWTRLGISVSRRVGASVVRSYTRRRIREAFRRHKAKFPRGFDIVCVARTNAAKKGEDIAASLVALTARAVTRWNERRPRACKAPPSSDTPEP